MVVKSILFHSKASIESMPILMESFFQKLKVGGRSNTTEVSFIVCSYICGQFKELRKVRVLKQVVFNMSSVIDRTGTYLRPMVKTHIINQDFISHRWREHPSIAGVVNYFKVKEEVSVRKNLNPSVKVSSPSSFLVLSRWRVNSSEVPPFLLLLLRLL